MIDKDIVSKIKQNFNYDFLYNHLKNASLNYKDNNKSIDIEKIYEIIQSLPKDYINSINKNYDLNQINFDLNKKMINEKIIGDGQNSKTLKYINNFEIVDLNLVLMLSRIFKDIKKIYYYGRFYFLKNKILIIFKEANSFCFEIGYLNDLNSFIVEYLIDITYNKNQNNNITYFDNYFNEFNADIILNGIYNNKMTNTFILGDIICYFYELSESNKKDNNINTFDSI